MGWKYVIDVDTQGAYVGKDNTLAFKVNGCDLIINADTLNSLEKLSDTGETAYNDGYAKGLKDGQHKSDTEEYHVGMKDAWDIVRKIFDMNDYQRYAIFGSENSRYIMMNLPIGEVVEKLKTYEEIKTGDEVIYNNTIICVVLAPETDNRYASIIDGCGKHYFADHRELKKTGKHYDHIEQLLAEMKERQKSCSNCKHEFKLRCEWPCEDCLCHDRWESKGDAE